MYKPALFAVVAACAGPSGPLDCSKYDETPDFACDYGNDDGACLEYAFGEEPELEAAESEACIDAGAEVVEACPHPDTTPERGVAGCTARWARTGCYTYWYDANSWNDSVGTSCLTAGNFVVGPP